jgi:hypothetical protein
VGPVGFDFPVLAWGVPSSTELMYIVPLAESAQPIRVSLKTRPVALLGNPQRNGTGDMNASRLELVGDFDNKQESPWDTSRAFGP